MSYEDARGYLAGVLEDVSITSPIEQSIQRVYTDPPDKVPDLPCFIMYGSAGESDWAMGGVTALETHTEMVRLVLHDADADRAAALVEAYRKATITALASAGGLGGNGVISKLAWERRASAPYGGQEYFVQDFFITFGTTP
jgi:hypothetical protein